MPQDKHLRVSGTATPYIDKNSLVVPAFDGLVAVTVTDIRGNVLYIYHPLAGWYIEVDNRIQEIGKQDDN